LIDMRLLVLGAVLSFSSILTGCSSGPEGAKSAASSKQEKSAKSSKSSESENSVEQQQLQESKKTPQQSPSENASKNTKAWTPAPPPTTKPPLQTVTVPSQMRQSVGSVKPVTENLTGRLQAIDSMIEAEPDDTGFQPKQFNKIRERPPPRTRKPVYYEDESLLPSEPRTSAKDGQPRFEDIIANIRKRKTSSEPQLFAERVRRPHSWLDRDDEDHPTREPRKSETEQQPRTMRYHSVHDRD
jgi:outer membrane murein-binding lipoprotein Lpp